jgi:hypothetical protein
MSDRIRVYQSFYILAMSDSNLSYRSPEMEPENEERFLEERFLHDTL